MKMMTHTLLGCAVLLAAVTASAAEFYRLDLSKNNPGDKFVTVDDSGKQRSQRPTWGMWPREKNTAGGEVVEINGVKAIKIAKGLQINSSEWSADVPDAQQSVIYARFKVMIDKLGDKVNGSLTLQQQNGRAAAFVGLVGDFNKPQVVISNGDGKGYVRWIPVAPFKVGEWTVIDLKLDFNNKRSDISVNGSLPLTGNIFRHADAWEGTMWAKAAGDKSYRYDLKADSADLYVSDVEFSAEPFPGAALK